MKFISHRGNLKAIIKEEENNPEIIEKVIKLGFEVEIDLRVNKSKLYLGHDVNQYFIDESFLTKNKNKLWIHAKNDDAIKYLVNHNKNYNYFWHENDAYTITSKGFLWTHVNSNSKLKSSNYIFGKKTILTLPELSKINNLKIIKSMNYSGICSDNISFYKNLFYEKK